PGHFHLADEEFNLHELSFAWCDAIGIAAKDGSACSQGVALDLARGRATRIGRVPAAQADPVFTASSYGWSPLDQIVGAPQGRLGLRLSWSEVCDFSFTRQDWKQHVPNGISEVRGSFVATVASRGQTRFGSIWVADGVVRRRH